MFSPYVPIFEPECFVTIPIGKPSEAVNLDIYTESLVGLPRNACYTNGTELVTILRAGHTLC